MAYLDRPGSTGPGAFIGGRDGSGRINPNVPPGVRIPRGITTEDWEQRQATEGGFKTVEDWRRAWQRAWQQQYFGEE